MSFSKILKWLILSLLISGFVFAQTASLSKYQLARKLFREGDYQKSEKLFKELVNSDKNNWMYISGLNALYVQKKEFGKSIKLLNNKLNLSPKDVMALCELGVVYYKKENFDSTYLYWDKAFEAAGSDKNKITGVINYPIRYRLNDKAIEYLTEAQERVPDRRTFLHQLGNVYISMSNFEKALEVYCDILEKDPKQFSVAQSLVRRMFTGNKVDPEVGELIRERYEKTGEQYFLELLKEFYTKAKEYEKLKKVVLQIFELNKDFNQLFSLGNELHRNKKNNSAKEIFELIISKSGDTPLQITAKIKLLDIKKDEIDDKSEDKRENYIELSAQYQKIFDELKHKSFEPELLYKLAELDEITIQSYSKYFSLSKKYPRNKFGAWAEVKIADYYTSEEKLDSALVYLKKASFSKQISRELKNRIDFQIVKNLFWQNDYKSVVKRISSVSRNYKNSKSNEAIELSLLMSLSQKDSVNLTKYAKADFLKTIGKLTEAALLYDELAQNENLLGLNFYSAIKFAEVKIEQQMYAEAIEILEKLAQKEKISPFYDKALYLQGKIYHYGLGELTKAVEIYSDVIKKYPDSIYLNECRNNIMLIKK